MSLAKDALTVFVHQLIIRLCPLLQIGIKELHKLQDNFPHFNRTIRFVSENELLFNLQK